MKITTLSLVVIVLATGSDSTIFDQLPADRQVPIGERFLQDMRQASRDLRQSKMLKNRAIVGATRAIGSAKIGLIKNARDAKIDLINRIVTRKSAAIRDAAAAKRSLINWLVRVKTEPIVRKANFVRNLTHASVNYVKDGVQSGIAKLSDFSKLLETEASEAPKAPNVKYVFVPAAQQVFPPVHSIHLATFAAPMIPVFHYYKPASQSDCEKQKELSKPEDLSSVSFPEDTQAVEESNEDEAGENEPENLPPVFQIVGPAPERAPEVFENSEDTFVSRKTESLPGDVQESFVRFQEAPVKFESTQNLDESPVRFEEISDSSEDSSVAPLELPGAFQDVEKAPVFEYFGDLRSAGEKTENESKNPSNESDRFLPGLFPGYVPSFPANPLPPAFQQLATVPEQAAFQPQPLPPFLQAVEDSNAESRTPNAGFQQ